jgi:hypothetical protein
MKLYFDTCCWGRSEDNHNDVKIRREANAILKIIVHAGTYSYPIYGSRVVEEEIGANRDESKRQKVMNYYKRTITARSAYVENVFNHVRPLALAAGIRGRDVLHLCHAVACGAGYLFTTDKNFWNAASELKLPIIVINPLKFFLVEGM